MNISKYILFLAGVVLLLSGCNANDAPKHTTQKTQTKTQERYVDFNRFKEGRPCAEVKFMCLPESQDKSWQSIPLKDGLDMFELSPEVMAKRKAIIQRWRDEEDGKVKEQSVKLAAISEAFYDRVEAKQFLVKMEKGLEKEFPGFWRDVPKKVRYRWIRRAMSKADKYGYNGGGKNMRAKSEIIELCARIGLDFDLDPKWKSITHFISLSQGPAQSYAWEACHYIDFTIFKKDFDDRGNRYTDWYFRDVLTYLPQPKRPIPKLND